MIRHMFVFGVILPTLVTILLFVAFLICWFKFNVRERIFSKRKLFSKQIKHAMAPHRAAQAKQNHIYTADPAQRKNPTGNGVKDTSGTVRTSGAGTGGVGGGICGGGGSVLSRKPKRYENCTTPPEDQEENVDEHHDEHSVGDDPEAALCGACEDEAVHAHAQKLSGFANLNICASPTHSAAGDDEAEDDEDDDGSGRETGSTDRGNNEEEDEEDQNHTDTEDHTVAETQYVQVKQVGSMFQHTFHFPASECSHLSNSLAVDSEDGGSEDGNYGHFVPLSQLLRDTKAKQFYAAAHTRADSPAIMDLSDGGGNGAGCVETTIGVNCTDKARLIPSV